MTRLYRERGTSWGHGVFISGVSSHRGPSRSCRGLSVLGRAGWERCYRHGPPRSAPGAGGASGTGGAGGFSGGC